MTWRATCKTSSRRCLSAMRWWRATPRFTRQHRGEIDFFRLLSDRLLDCLLALCQHYLRCRCGAITAF
eukprot:748746-Prorocentrum_lima.AAC.1